MKKVLRGLPVFIACCFSLAAYTQDVLPEFGKIDIADLKMQECPFYKGASAMNLFKVQTINVDAASTNGFIKTVTEVRIRTKIFSEAGFKNANIEIPYVSSSSVKITDVDAVIYNMGENVSVVTTQLDKADIFKDKSASTKSIRFTYPGLQKGSVIEYRYTRTEINSYYVPSFFFQDLIPCRFAKCTFHMFGFLDMSYHITGNMTCQQDSVNKRYTNEKFNEFVRSFTMHNVPAFEPEPFMSSFNDNMQHVEFAVLPTGHFVTDKRDARWELYNRFLTRDPYFGGQLDVNIDSTKKFIDSVATLPVNDTIINATLAFIKKHVTWNGEQSFYPANIQECWNNRGGNSAELNILLINLLRKAGLKCYPILISTRSNGIVNQNFASLNQFDGVDALVIDGGNSFVLDCTQKNLYFKTTPYDVIDRDVFIVDADSSRWIALTDNRMLNQTAFTVNTQVDSTGMLNGFGDLIYTGIAKNEALTASRILHDGEEREKFMNSSGSDFKIDSARDVHADDNCDTLIHKIFFHNNLSNTGDLYFLDPFMFSLFEKNPFKDTARSFDIDLGLKQTFAVKLHVLLSDNFSVEEAPKSVMIRMADNSIIFRREILTSSNQVLVKIAFTINRPQFDREEYSGLKTFFDKVYGLINEQVVLKKTE